MGARGFVIYCWQTVITIYVINSQLSIFPRFNTYGWVGVGLSAPIFLKFVIRQNPADIRHQTVHINVWMHRHWIFLKVKHSSVAAFAIIKNRKERLQRKTFAGTPLLKNSKREFNMRLGFLSDLHTDYNHLHHFETIIPRLIQRKRLDGLCILGDTATGVDGALEFYQSLQQRIAIPLRILPGNHDIYVRDAARKTAEEVQHESTEAYFKLLYHPDLSLYLNPIITPHWLIVGISGWYDYSFVPGDPDKLARHPVSKYVWPDQMMINHRQIDAARDERWVEDDLERMTELFNRPEARHRKRLVAMHFLPTDQLIRRKRYPMYRHFIVQLGSNRYQRFFETHDVARSVSGHSHMPTRCDVNGIHYENVSLGYGFQWADASDAQGELERILYILEDD